MKNLIITKNVLVHEFMINLIKIYHFFFRYCFENEIHELGLFIIIIHWFENYSKFFLC